MPSLTWDVDPVFVHIGSFGLRYYALVFLGVLGEGEPKEQGASEKGEGRSY